MEEFKKLKQQVERKRKLIKKHQDELRDLLTECSHQERVNKSYYDNGDYYNMASTTHYQECVVCAKRFEQSIKSHGYYG